MTSAKAIISGDGVHSRIHGAVRFLPQREGVLVLADLYGLPDSETGFFAVHIHEGGDCRGKGFPGTGGHFNPGKLFHPQHAGNLPPLLSNGGRAYMAVLTNRLRLQDVIGRTVVIYSGPDDFRSQPAGNPGEKIACGLIRRE